jgi:putative ABC transport system permease protein
MVLLSAFGIFILILSGFLVVNTLSALLGQQVRQIGIMKAIGARTSQVASLYLGMALVFGLLGVIVGAPLGWLGARWLAVFVAGIINSDVTDLSVSASVLGLEVGVGLLAPLLAASVPVLSGTGVTVREALNDRSIAACATSAACRVRGCCRCAMLSAAKGVWRSPWRRSRSPARSLSP